ncbi:MAG TPA: YihY/virulence factor BrkB family protein [Solirubrobacteraceae bacterium]|nr:YihY/virulence factor BrkB family protein [Solirubrobacteraceae bacterium]
MSERLRAFDRRQQHSRLLAFPVAVIKKFTEDQAGQLGALIAYYAFISLFPLLLILVTVLGFVLQDHPSERQTILDGTLGKIPLISDSITIQGLHGSVAALVVGVVLALLAGMGITNATQSAFNRIWGVPFKSRPNAIVRRLHSLGALLLLGSLSVVSAVVAGAVGAGGESFIAGVIATLVALAFNLLLFFLAFKLLTAKSLEWRDVIIGVIVATVFWQLLEHLGGIYVDHTLKRTTPLYGVFAIVLGLLAWLFLAGQLVLVAAEVNVVRYYRLWPRTLFTEDVLDADRRAMTMSAEVEERLEIQNVEVDFDGN